MDKLEVGQKVIVVRAMESLSHLIGTVTTILDVKIEKGADWYLTDIYSEKRPASLPPQIRNYWGKRNCFKPYYDGDQGSHWDAGVWKPKVLREKEINDHAKSAGNRVTNKPDTARES